ncbi:uncharacterized protein CIMG_09356 [Coccidioides immitis RS]|uniref:RING finger domain-containing protein n=4 Tax=Coccidioides immitis TaxID=5501 RepID=J3K261_COCIM|nr:uncharacterized protein CIMG_09356 [Coccidioides immitis RS]KMP08975.1 hypothetical protein CIRG_08656 [Coccidioides immitis RMSCC 2394]KMU74129.1 hypothetical protein CISG_04058 [Coccidioides immitis RMSCC 3703]KMU89210.1 hypothetical protein CIHG_07144 [Coccidioides immitis H538.4]TPX20813.1 hypothetical protein DIZ76_016709 [Coccidioides immitis]EAS28152.3 hypothetical protein CIMG_09356 [Coccidioides immitis RS]
MNRTPSIQFLTSTPSRKRPHDQISGSNSESRSESPWTAQEEASNSANSRSFGGARSQNLQLPRIRYPGDGYDYRRPIMSTGVPPPPPSFLQAQPQPNVIDLTQDDSSPPSRSPQRSWIPSSGSRPTGASRPPRFGRNIMADVVNLEQEPGQSPSNNQQSSPEVQWLGSISRGARPRTQPQQTTSSEHHHRGLPFRRGGLMNLLRADRLALNRTQEFAEEMALRTRDIVAFSHAMTPFWIGEAPRHGIDLTIDLDNPQMDLTLVGLESLNPDGRPTSPAYQSPPAPPAGFTRTAGEDDVVICPNCEHELGTGDDPIQKQVWVARSCGHVYCGLCTKNRASSRGRKAAVPAKTRPFSKCVVTDCGKSVSQPRTMLQIYL